MADSKYQLISGDGVFNEASLEEFAKKIGLHGVGRSYGVVSIIGPQSSGKSTLLNEVFKTSFDKLDATQGMKQTTQGIWMARSVNDIKTEPLTMVFDVEGSDGRERKDDTTFEKRSALFALSTSDILLINLKCDNIGLQNGAGVPLLRTVIEVMMRLVNNPRKTTLMFVLRDKNKTTPLEMHKQTVEQIVQEVWDSVNKPEKYASLSRADVFNVEVVALTNYEYNNDGFIMEVADLRNQICGLIHGGGGSQRDSSSVFVDKLKLVWDKIKENEDLNLPSISLLVYIHRCEEIAKKRYYELTSNEKWRKLDDEAQKQLVDGFGEKLSSLIKTCMEGYDEDAKLYPVDAESEGRKILVRGVLQLVSLAYQSILGHLRRKSIGDFKINFDEAIASGENKVINIDEAIASGEKKIAAAVCKCSTLAEFDKGCKDAAIAGDAFQNAGLKSEKERQELESEIKAAIKDAGLESLKERKNLESDIEEHVTSAKSDHILKTHKVHLQGKLDICVKEYLEAGDDTTWPSIRKLLERELKSTKENYLCGLDRYGIDEKRKEIMLAALKKHAYNVVETISEMKAEHTSVWKHMTQKFDEVFVNELKSEINRVKGPPSTKFIDDAAEVARRAALILLVVRAAIRLEDNSNDDIESIMRGQPLPKKWTNATKTLLQPEECEDLYSLLISETDPVRQETVDRKNTIQYGGIVLTMTGVTVATAGAVAATAFLMEPVSATYVARGGWLVGKKTLASIKELSGALLKKWTPSASKP